MAGRKKLSKCLLFSIFEPKLSQLRVFLTVYLVKKLGSSFTEFVYACYITLTYYFFCKIILEITYIK